MGAGNVLFIEWLSAYSAAQLRFACPAVAEEQDLDLRVDLFSGLKVFVVGTDFIQDVLIMILSANLGWEIIELAAI
jgi:hypothetical protein